MQFSHPIQALLAQSSASSLGTLTSSPSTASDVLYTASIVAGFAYLGLNAFTSWRARTMNVTRVTSAEANPAARPGFLRVDEAARAAALERGDAFDESLRARETAQVATLAPAQKSFSLFAFALSAFTLVSMLFGSIWQISWIGQYAKELSAQGRLAAIVREHPVAFIVAVLVCGLQIVRFVTERRAT